MSNERIKIGAKVAADVVMRPRASLGLTYGSIYDIECVDVDGNVKWTERVHNLVVDLGLNHALSVITASAHVSAWAVGLTTSAATFAAGDTMASHAGWVECQTYSEAVREVYTAGAISGKSVDNSASKASFSINGTTQVGGAFLSESNTKGGSTGILFGGAAFSAERSVVSSDTVNVTVTVTSEVT